MATGMREKRAKNSEIWKIISPILRYRLMILICMGLWVNLVCDMGQMTCQVFLQPL